MDVETPVPTQPSPKELESMYQDMLSSKVQACTDELSELLKRHNCRLEVEQRVRNGVPGPTQIVVISN